MAQFFENRLLNYGVLPLVGLLLGSSLDEFKNKFHGAKTKKHSRRVTQLVDDDI